MELNEIRNANEYIQQLELVDNDLDLIKANLLEARFAEVTLSGLNGNTVLRRLFSDKDMDEVMFKVKDILMKERKEIVNKLHDMGVGMGMDCIRDDEDEPHMGRDQPTKDAQYCWDKLDEQTGAFGRRNLSEV